MLCDECGEREAALFLKVMLNDACLETKLCERCAQAKSATGLYFDVDIGALTDAGEGQPPLLFDPEAYDSVCPQCGLTAAELARTRLLGCATCYEAHAEPLSQVLEVVQGISPKTQRSKATNQRREQPATAGPKQGDVALAELEAELRQAVELEQYDRAAMLRDRIRELRQLLGV